MDDKFYIDTLANQKIRAYKEGDHILYLIGYNNYILDVQNNESFDYNDFKAVSPVGIDIIGSIAIYNENTFEDFETVLNEFNDNIKNNIIHDSNRNLIGLAIKEILYLDDCESIEFEYKSIDNEIVFIDNCFEIMNNNIICIQSISNFKFNKNSPTTNLPSDDSSTKGIIYNDNNNKINFDSFSNINNNDIQNLLSNTTFKENNIKYNVIKDFMYINTIYITFDSISEINLQLCDNDEYNYKSEYLALVNKSSDSYSTIIEQLYKSHLSSIKKYINNNTIPKIIYNSIFNAYPLIIPTEIKLEKDSHIIPNKDIYSKYNTQGLTSFNKSIINLKQYKPEVPLNLFINVNKELENEYTIRATIKGNCEYFHYGHGNITDIGWGCAYRSLQTLYSWFLLNTEIPFKDENRKVPTIKEIQETLVKIGDKEKPFIGSSDWIGAIEVNMVLNELIGVESKIVFVANGGEMDSKGRELLYHFTHIGTPVMIGGGSFAYTIIGVDYDRVNGKSKFLILDPHYGGVDDEKILINKGWCNWKDSSLFNKQNFYNMCMPQV